MFDHKNLATEGLYPGLVSTFSIAVLGTLEIEVIIRPTTGGGGGIGLPKKDKYRVKIRVKRKNKVWEYETDVNKPTARVIAKLASIITKQPEVVIESNLVKVEKMEKPEPSIKVNKK